MIECRRLDFCRKGADVAIVIGTYGDQARWAPLAARAFESAMDQTVRARSVVWTHADTLKDARNTGIDATTSEWLIHLDADDLLDSRYVEKMLEGSGDLRQPMTLGFYADGHEDDYPVFIPAKSHFNQGNWLVVGTMVRRTFFEAVGYWGDEPLYEDWAAWWRCWKEGAEIGQAPGAIYKVFVNPTGRNIPDRAQQEYWFERIARELT